MDARDARVVLARARRVDVVEVLEEARDDGLLVDGRRLEVLGYYFG